LKLAKLTGENKYERFAVAVLRLAAVQIRRHPQGFGRALSAMEFHLGSTKEIVVVGEKGNELERTLLAGYHPDSVVVLARGDEEPDLPLLVDRPAIGGNATAYVCRDLVCLRPVTDPADLVAAIRS
jgi:uncharacterized protein YyaL (SSP411 family)